MAWILVFGLSLVYDFMDAAFGEKINVMPTIISVLYLVFFGLGLYFAKKGKMMAGILELVAGAINSSN